MVQAESGEEWQKERAPIACKWNRSYIGSSPFLEMIWRYSKCLQVFFPDDAVEIVGFYSMDVVQWSIFLVPILAPGLSEDKRWEVEPWPQVLAFPWLQKGRVWSNTIRSQSYAETGVAHLGGGAWVSQHHGSVPERRHLCKAWDLSITWHLVEYVWLPMFACFSFTKISKVVL